MEISAHDLLNASLEATADGVLVVGGDGRILLYNRRFVQMWQVPPQLLQAAEIGGVRAHASGLLRDPQTFLKSTERLYTDERERTDVLAFRDGRIVERFSAPLMLQDRVAGRVFSFRDITQYRRVASRLEASEQKYEYLVQNTNSIILRWNPEGRITFINEYGQRLLGFTQEELVGKPVLGTIVARTESTGRDLVALIQAITSAPEDYQHNENENVGKDGRRIWVAWANRPIYRHGRLEEILSIGIDITERKRLEQQLLQAQKMEAVGRLAGGVAHDFNNLLTVIGGYCELLLSGMDGQDSHREEVGEIKNATARAAALTRQLLAFSRSQIVQPRALELNAVVTGVAGMLRRLIGEHIELEVRSTGGPLRAFADPGNVEQILLNLAVNARDAMPGGGRLEIATDAVRLDREFTREHYMVKPGRYVRLSVTDTGSGMSSEVLEHVFEPFFTTKALGKGTGLGLSTVYGIVKQNDGYVFLESQPGAGTTVTIYFPEQLDPAPEPEPSQPEPSRRTGEREVILLVEDEHSVRSFTRTVLEKQGYTVRTAATGGEVLEQWEKLAAGADLLVTDIVLPGISGRQLACRLRQRNAALKVLFVSGYSAHPCTRDEDGTEFLTKPYNTETLLRRIRRILDG